MLNFGLFAGNALRFAFQIFTVYYRSHAISGYFISLAVVHVVTLAEGHPSNLLR